MVVMIVEFDPAYGKIRCCRIFDIVLHCCPLVLDLPFFRITYPVPHCSTLVTFSGLTAESLSGDFEGRCDAL